VKVKFVSPELRDKLYEVEEAIDQAIRSEKFMLQKGAGVQLSFCLSDELRKILQLRYKGWNFDFQDGGESGTWITIYHV